MKIQIIVMALTLSISFLSIHMHELEAQNATNNASNIAPNLTESANETLSGFGQSLSAFIKGMNISIQSENSSIIETGKNASDTVPEMLNNTWKASN